MKEFIGKWDDVYEYDDSPEAAKEAVDKLIMFLARTGVSPNGESLYQSDQVHEEVIDLVADIIENALRFTESAGET
ncbi:hypothetical protein A7P85_04250 [Eikenella corrodens]|uniref:Uncharacterized protein n=1 Tax=Eikenella corrodens TaxID=539 RepID=A0A1A9RGC1_EIKCO|nr:hypothetical protein [Eikenella corrodens]OAM16983.1 hypothetical protein A7P85_04250 [Eikenella corrodens]